MISLPLRLSLLALAGAQAVGRVEAPPADIPAVTALTAPIVGVAAPAPEAVDWPVLETQMLRAAGADRGSQAQTWRLGAAYMMQRDPRMSPGEALARSLAVAHLLSAREERVLTEALDQKTSEISSVFSSFFDNGGGLFIHSGVGLVRLDDRGDWQRVPVAGGTMASTRQVGLVDGRLAVAGRRKDHEKESVFVFRGQEAGSAEPWSHWYEGQAQAFGFLSGRHYLATDRGVLYRSRRWWRSPESGKRWRPSGLDDAGVVSLREEGGALVAETAGGQTFTGAPLSLLERLAASWRSRRWAPPVMWSSAPTAAAKREDVLFRHFKSADGHYALEGRELVQAAPRSSGYWARLFTTPWEVRDAAEGPDGRLWMATNFGLRTALPAWELVREPSLAEMAKAPAIPRADLPVADAALWERLESFALASIGIARASRLAEWKRATAEALRNEPGLALDAALAEAFGVVHSLEPGAVKALRAVFAQEPWKTGVPFSGVFDAAGDLFFTREYSLYRGAGPGIRVPGVDEAWQVERIDDAYYISGARGLRRWDGRSDHTVALISEPVRAFASFQGRLYADAGSGLKRQAGDGWEDASLGDARRQFIGLDGARRLFVHDGRLYAAHAKGLFVLEDPGERRWTAVVSGVGVNDAAFFEGRLVLATTRGVRIVEGGQARWAPESGDGEFYRLRPTSQGLVALGLRTVVLSRGAWSALPFWDGVKDFLHRDGFGYVTRSDSAKPFFPEGWSEALLQGLSGALEPASAPPRGSSRLADGKGRSLL